MTKDPAPSEVEGDLQLEDIPGNEMGQYCHAVAARNLHWKFTRKGQVVIQPCPNGTTGLPAGHVLLRGLQSSLEAETLLR